MGEKSKKIGEIGEDIVSNFLDLIGWKNILKNQNISCAKPTKHANPNAKNGKRETHGIDCLQVYKSNLESDTVESILISVKHTNEPYPRNPNTIFKTHLKDIAQTTECYRKSELKSTQIKNFPGNKKSKDISVIFWLSSSENTYDDVKKEVSKIKIEDDLQFEVIYLIDNRQVDFIYTVINYIKSNHLTKTHLFYYPETSLNYTDKKIQRFGTILPVEFLTSPILPILLKGSNDEIDTFCIASLDNFDEDGLTRLIQMARECTNEISCKYLLLFPNYISTQHIDAVMTAKRKFDNSLSDNIFIENFQPDFRSLAK